SQRNIFQRRLRDNQDEIEVTCLDVLQRIRLELESRRLTTENDYQKRNESYDTFSENIEKMVDGVSNNLIEVLFNKLFNSIFGFRFESGVFSNSVKSYTKEMDFDTVEPLINQAYSDVIDKSMQAYYRLIGKLKIDDYSDLIDKDSHKVTTIYN